MKFGEFATYGEDTRFSWVDLSREISEISGFYVGGRLNTGRWPIDIKSVAGDQHNIVRSSTKCMSVIDNAHVDDRQKIK